MKKRVSRNSSSKISWIVGAVLVLALLVLGVMYFRSSGYIVAGGSTSGSTTCSDSDGGMNVYVSGKATGRISSTSPVQTYSDACVLSNLRERYCSGGYVRTASTSCPQGYSCSGSRCRVNAITR